MWIGFARPQVSSVTVVGVGASLLTPSANLTNGRPAQTSRLQWLSEIAPTITDVVKVQFMFAKEFVPGLIGLFGLSIFGVSNGAGLKFSFTGKRVGDSDFTYDLGGNTGEQRAVMRNDGSVVVVCIPAAGLDEIEGVEMTISNDVGGSVAIPVSGYLDLGDFWCSPAFDINIDANWKYTFPDNNTAPDSKNYQPWPEADPPGRVLNFSRSNMSFADVFVSGATPCWERIRTLCCNGQVSVVIPRYGSLASLDATSLNLTASFGKMKFGDIPRANGDLFSMSGTVAEIPALLAGDDDN